MDSTNHTPNVVPLSTGSVYARVSIATFPVIGKVPLKHSRGFLDATLDGDQHARWAKEHPTAGIAGRTGEVIAPGLRALVADRDDRHGGDVTLANLVAEHGDLPDTWQTDRGHYWFSYPDGLNVRSTANQFGAGLDSRAADAYVVLPPSLHPSGVRYAWLPGRAPWETPIAPAPEWLLNHAVIPPRAERKPLTGTEWVTLLESLQQGNRNSGLARIGGLLFHALPAALAARLTELVNGCCCKPPLGDHELWTVIDSLAKREAAKLDVTRGPIRE